MQDEENDDQAKIHSSNSDLSASDVEYDLEAITREESVTQGANV